MIVVIVPRPSKTDDGKNIVPESVQEKNAVETLTPNEYQKLAMRTCNIPFGDKTNMLIHATTGLASEAGEFAGLLQKIYQGHEYDREHALKELGDCCWMIAEACTALDAKLEDVMRMNIDKLRARYPDGFDPEKSLHREEGDV